MDEETVDLLKQRQERSSQITEDFIRETGVIPSSINDIVKYLLDKNRLDDLVIINHVYYTPISIDVIQRSIPLLDAGDDKQLSKLIETGAYLDYSVTNMRMLAKKVPASFVLTHQTFKKFGYE